MNELNNDFTGARYMGEIKELKKEKERLEAALPKDMKKPSTMVKETNNHSGMVILKSMGPLMPATV